LEKHKFSIANQKQEKAGFPI